jgi:hypothetical protein
MNPAFHAAIAAARRRQEQEEERMTPYNADDLNGWEFKIVRSTFGRFSNQEIVQRLIAEEAQNGWEMLEKFDDYRIRFKRRVDKRSLHSGGSLDPYRTSYRANRTIIPLIAAAVGLLLVTGILLASRGKLDNDSLPPLIIVGTVLLILLVVLVVRRK